MSLIHDHVLSVNIHLACLLSSYIQVSFFYMIHMFLHITMYKHDESVKKLNIPCVHTQPKTYILTQIISSNIYIQNVYKYTQVYPYHINKSYNLNTVAMT